MGAWCYITNMGKHARFIIFRVCFIIDHLWLGQTRVDEFIFVESRIMHLFLINNAPHKDREHIIGGDSAFPILVAHIGDEIGEHVIIFLCHIRPPNQFHIPDATIP